MQRLLSLSLALLILLGSAGVTVSRHFCRGELKSIALFGQAEKCHADQTVKQCPFHPPAPDQKKGCCDDDVLTFQVDDQEPVDLTLELPVPVAHPPVFPPLLATYRAPHPRPRKNTRFENYRPPPLPLDAPREYQVFRL